MNNELVQKPKTRIKIRCLQCNGTGKIGKTGCPKCHGIGQINKLND